MTQEPLSMSEQPTLTEDELQVLAYQGTKEAIEKIDAYLKSESDYEKRAYAEMSLEECEFLYYQPTNEKEEEEFMLCFLINQKQNRVDDMHADIDNLEEKIEKFELEKKVHDQVIVEHPDKKEAWQYNCIEELIFNDRNKVPQLQEKIAYDEAWIAEAEKMITADKYKSGIPERYWSHYSFGFEDECCDEKDCDCGDEHCPFCSSMDEPPF